MKRFIWSHVVVFLMFLLFATMAEAGQNGDCRLQGTWISFDNGVPTWVSSSQGQSNSSGTSELEYPAFTIGDPNEAGSTNMRGAWERTGGNTFAYTMIGYAHDASGTPLWINRMSGTLTLMNGCNTAEVTATINIFLCDESGVCPDPFGETPLVYEYPITYAKRVTVE